MRRVLGAKLQGSALEQVKLVSFGDSHLLTSLIEPDFFENVIIIDDPRVIQSTPDFSCG